MNPNLTEISDAFYNSKMKELEADAKDPTKQNLRVTKNLHEIVSNIMAPMVSAGLVTVLTPDVVNDKMARFWCVDASPDKAIGKISVMTYLDTAGTRFYKLEQFASACSSESFSEPDGIQTADLTSFVVNLCQIAGEARATMVFEAANK